MKFEYNGKQLEINDRLALELNILINNTVKDDDDVLLVFDGQEGSGKTTLKTLVGAYISNRLKTCYDIYSPYTTENILFSGEDYIKFSLEPKYSHQINDLDEATDLLNKANAKNKDSLKFTNYLRRCRFMNQFHLITSPAFHDIHPYIIKWRMKLLIHLEKNIIKNDKSLSGYSIDRGYFKIYYRNNDLLKCYNLFFYNYLYPDDKNNYFTGKFHINKNDVLNWEEYNIKKDLYNKKEYLGHEIDKKQIETIEIKNWKFDIEYLKYLNENYKQGEIANILNIDRTYWWNVKKKLRIEQNGTE